VVDGKEPGFYSALAAYAASGRVQLHMPGHKGGRGFRLPELAAVGHLDFTEIPGLDDWHRPDGVLLEAQRQLALCYGAKASYFLVNGATSGIHALLMALGDEARVLLPRQAHRSFYGGMVLAGTVPSYIPTRLDEKWGLPLVTEVNEVTPLISNQQLVAWFGTSPSYFGTCGAEEEIIARVHGQGMLAFIDAAHGAHYGFHPGYPPSSLQQGADAVVHGLHKTLPALTGVACLHLAETMGDRQPSVVQALDLLITTSPSQPLLASGDWARSWLSSSVGQDGLDKMYHLSEQFNAALKEVKGLERILVPGKERSNDPGRVSIGLCGLSLTGYELEILLATEYGIQVEMAGANYVVALFTPFNTAAEWQALLAALTAIAARYQGLSNYNRVLLPPLAPMVLKPRAAHFAPRRRVRVSQAGGLLSGEIVAAYPPGIPCLLPGETITDEMVTYLQYLAQSGGRIQGMLDPEAQYIYVIDI